jgi:hypothetical protein
VVLEYGLTPVADETKKRTTSFAKSLDDLVKETAALDKLSPAVREAFNRSADDLQWQNERAGKRRGEQERQTDERRPSHAPSPQMHLKPEGPVRRAMDRKIDYEKLRAINDAAKKRAAASRSRTLSRDIDRER